MLTDGELCELFTRDNARAVQCLQSAETKSMMAAVGNTDKRLTKTKTSFYTVFIFISGSLLCISFGTMLGWPSPTYPSLLAKDALIPITIDQSAMIAGMLLNGFVIATPFAICECLGSKLGVLLGAAIMFCGWLLMIGARDVLGLCFSRLLVGIGSGFGIGKLRTYLNEICEKEDAANLQKLIITGINFGILLTFSVGPYVSFRTLAIAAAVVPGLAFLTFTVVPDTPVHLYRQHKINTAVAVLQNVHGKECVENEFQNVKNSVENKPTNKTIFQILRNKHTRRSFVVLTFLMTVQQFSGAPALIVYSQITYTEFNCYYPSVCSIIYVIVYLLSSCVAVKYIPSFKRKPVLLLSCVVCMATSAINASYAYAKPENVYYTAIPFVSMLIYTFFHSIGLAIVPGLVVNDIFPISCRCAMNCYLNMYTAQLAVIVTKIFQVLYDQFTLFVPFCMFTVVSFFGSFVIIVCLSEPKGQSERNRIASIT